MELLFHWQELQALSWKVTWYNLVSKNHNKSVILYRILIPPCKNSLIASDIVKIATLRGQIRIDGNGKNVAENIPKMTTSQAEVVFGDKKMAKTTLFHNATPLLVQFFLHGKW